MSWAYDMYFMQDVCSLKQSSDANMEATKVPRHKYKPVKPAQME